METVGEATWSHSLKSLRPGGVVAVAGATTGSSADADLTRLFFRGLRVVGSTMGTWTELARLQQLLVTTGVRPLVDRVVELEEVPDALGDLIDGRVRGKIVVRLP